MKWLIKPLVRFFQRSEINIINILIFFFLEINKNTCLTYEQLNYFITLHDSNF